jgi:hypothetical protein
MILDPNHYLDLNHGQFAGTSASDLAGSTEPLRTLRTLIILQWPQCSQCFSGSRSTEVC